MSLHSKDQIRNTPLDDVYAQADLSVVMPKYKMPEHQHSSRNAFSVVRDELMLDGNSRQNLATFCQTWVDPEVHELMDLCVDKNMIDKDEYPQSAEIEGRCVNMLADLWNSPEAANTLGCSTTGSSEAAMLGGMAMKWRWREKMKAQGKPTDKPNMITGPVQICWHKFARYWDVELREIPMEHDRLLMTPAEVLKRCDENTIGVVPTLGVTFTCAYEPVKAVADALDRLQEEKGLDIPIHVDGASGGFLAPFCAPELEWDFRIPRVKSINTSGHKFGLAPLAVGWVVWREPADLPQDLIFNVNYLGGNMPTFALNFSRPGGQIACQYYNMLRLGKDGYRKVQNACYDNAQYLAEEIGKMGPFDIIYGGDPKTGIPALAWKIKDGFDTKGYTLYDLADRLRSRGWQVPAYSLPANCQDLVIQRILVRHGVSKDLGSLLIEDMHRCLEYFKKHPITRPLGGDEASGFHHQHRVIDGRPPIEGCQVDRIHHLRPFITRVDFKLPDGTPYVWTSRRHRWLGGLHDLSETESSGEVDPTRWWLEVGALARIGWWVATLFMIGSTCFAVASAAGLPPGLFGDFMASNLSALCA